MMIDRKKARELVEQFIGLRRPADDDEFAVVDDLTVEKPSGWIFFYTSKASLGGDQHRLIVGNGPIVVEKEDGSLHPLPTAWPVDVALRWYEGRRRPR